MTYQVQWPSCCMAWDSVIQCNPRILQNLKRSHQCMFLLFFLSFYLFLIIGMCTCQCVVMCMWVPPCWVQKMISNLMELELYLVVSQLIAVLETKHKSSGQVTKLLPQSRDFVGWLYCFHLKNSLITYLDRQDYYARPSWNYNYSKASYWLHIWMYFCMYVLVQNPRMTSWIYIYIYIFLSVWRQKVD